MLGNLLLSLVLCTSVRADRQGFPTERQILWQRSLEDALAISRSEKRPILVAVNMDGESASERIVRERYRDPAFVASTRSFVCVVASPFRHAARDHDDDGRRIPCPRLGEVTCGEHILLEPILFDRFLGGERIAPRHAVVLEDGTKSFDLFLLFDFRELDRNLAESAKAAPPAPAAPAVPALSGPPTEPASWIALAASKQNRGRSALERTLETVDERACAAALEAVSARGDAGSVDAFRVLFPRATRSSPGLLDGIDRASRSLGVEAGTSAAVWGRIGGLGRWPGAPGLGDDAALLRLAGSPGRSLLLAYAALGSTRDSELALLALEGTTTPEELAKVRDVIRSVGQRPDLETWWSAMRDAAPPDPLPAKPPEAWKDPAALEEELGELDGAVGAAPDDPEVLAKYGRTLLELAQRRMETGGSGADLLLQDAAQFLERAWNAGKRDTKLLFDRARVAYFSGDFAEEERLALTAEAGVEPADRLEAGRWVGDASARLLGARWRGDPAIEIGGILRGGRALLEVAADPTSDATDWISLGSFLGAVGMHREAVAVLQLGAERFPASAAVRQALNGELVVCGRIDLVPAKAEWIAARDPRSAEAAWFAGHAHLLAAENARREEAPVTADAEYRRSEACFLRAVEMRPEFRESTDPYRALCALGRGFAHLLADRRAEAAGCLVDAVAVRTDLSNLRDGLDRETVDLLDGALEWRETGASPVDVEKLVGDLERAAPGDATWIRAVSDTELREALRADGRGGVVEADRYLRASIDAGRRALGIASDEETKHALAQPLTVLAERTIARGDFEGARKPLAEAAVLLDEPPPADGADRAALEAVAVRLRERLGEARPRFRLGR